MAADAFENPEIGKKKMIKSSFDRMNSLQSRCGHRKLLIISINTLLFFHPSKLDSPHLLCAHPVVVPEVDGVVKDQPDDQVAPDELVQASTPSTAQKITKKKGK
jgi:hypothetical protein